MYTNYLSNRCIANNSNLPVRSSSDAGAVTNSSSESNCYMVISFWCYMQGQNLGGSTGFDFWIGDNSGAALGGRDGLCLTRCGCWESSLIWLLRGREVTGGISDFQGTLSRVSIGSLNVVSADEAASSSVRGWTTAGTFHFIVPYILYLARNKSATFPSLVVSICEHSSTSSEFAPSDAMPFWWSCSTPSQVRHLRSACPGQDLLHHHPHNPHPPHHPDLEDCSDHLPWRSASPQMLFQAS